MTRYLQDLVRDRCPLIKGADRQVLSELAWRANEDGVCWPSAETIAYDANVHLRSVGNAVVALCEAGILSVQSQVGRGRCCIYTLNVAIIDSLKKPARPVETMQSVPIPVETMHDVQGYDTETMQSVPETMQSVPINPAKSVINSANGSVKYARITDRTIQEYDNESNNRIDSETSHAHATTPTPTLAMILAESTPNYGYSDHDDFTTAFWSAYPRQRRGVKSNIRTLIRSRGIEAKDWIPIMASLGNYLGSPDVLRGVIISAERFLSGEWENYTEPITPPKPQSSQATKDRMAVHAIGEQARDYLAELKKRREADTPLPLPPAQIETKRKVESVGPLRLDEVRRRRGEGANGNSFRPVGESVGAYASQALFGGENGGSP